MGRDAEVLVVGSGIAGLTFALRAAERGRVLLLTKKERTDSTTNFARGGIAAGVGGDDDPSLHLRDTLAAGCGLSHREIAELVVREGPARVRELVDWGVRFHHENGRLSLGMEGGHSRRRILHAGDRTGREIERALVAAVEGHDRIRILQDVMVVDLLVEEREGEGERVCAGVLALDHARGVRVTLRAPATFLATGGCGQVYRHTTNPAIATGDGMAMAHRAGARIANMEFVQFHPTALYPTEDPAFLLSEAIRGEGGVLRLQDGTAFMDAHHPDRSLAPRDVVARAVHWEMERTGDPYVVLDVSAISPETFARRFPGALEGCRARGIEPLEDGIPVVPAAHYICGGVATDEDGRTSLPGLYAAGEVACTGIHGANRLASNSLLEAVVFSRRAALAVAAEAGSGLTEVELHVEALTSNEASAAPGSPGPPAAGSPGPPAAGDADDGRLAAVRDRLRDLMWHGAGIVRSDEGLARAMRELRELLHAEERMWDAGSWSLDGAEIRNLLRTAFLIVECARSRKESRGLHFNRDHPEPDDARFLADTVLEP